MAVTNDRPGLIRPQMPVRAVRPIVSFMSLALLVWAIVELGGLVTRHTTGPEMYGVLVAGLAVGAAGLALYATQMSVPRTWIIVAVAVVWAVVALGGLAGVAAHIVDPVHVGGPIDPRPRPLLAPLAFTAMGVVGEIVLWIWRRQPARSASTTESE